MYNYCYKNLFAQTKKKKSQAKLSSPMSQRFVSIELGWLSSRNLFVHSQFIPSFVPVPRTCESYRPHYLLAIIIPAFLIPFYGLCRSGCNNHSACFFFFFWRFLLLFASCWWGPPPPHKLGGDVKHKQSLSFFFFDQIDSSVVSNLYSIKMQNEHTFSSQGGI